MSHQSYFDLRLCTASKMTKGFFLLQIDHKGVSIKLRYLQNLHIAGLRTWGSIWLRLQTTVKPNFWGTQLYYGKPLWWDFSLQRHKIFRITISDFHRDHANLSVGFAGFIVLRRKSSLRTPENICSVAADIVLAIAVLTTSSSYLEYLNSMSTWQQDWSKN